MIDSEQIFHPGFWFVILGLLTVAFPLYVLVLWKSWKLAVVYLIAFLSFGVYIAFYCARNFGGAFVAGMTVGCLSVLLVPISIVICFILRRPFRNKYGEDVRRLRLYSLGGVGIMLTQLLPIAGSQAINTACFSSTQRNAAALIDAIDTYRQQNGVYPSVLGDLTPTYLLILPTPACSWLSAEEYRTQVGHELIACPDGSLLLVNLSMDGTGIERYQFSTDQWSAVSFLDGPCSHLP